MIDNDTELLPEELAVKSLAKNEIILPYADVLKAISHLNANNYIVFAWEGWISYPDGRCGHSGEHQGTEEFRGTPGNTIQEYCKNATAFILETIAQSQKEWDERPEVDEATLYFCLSVEHISHIGSLAARYD